MLYADVISFNEIFKKDVAYDNIRNHKKHMVSTSLNLSLKNTFFEEKKQGGGGGQIDPPAF